MLAFVKRRWFLTAVGFLLLALFILFAGPYFAFGSYRPLESFTAQAIFFLAIVALWVALRVIRRVRTALATGQFAAAVARQQEPAAPSAEAVQLRERFEEAVSTLKGPRGAARSLYDLPWYVIIGAPGSGKTTALVNSGLRFPLEQRVGKAALRGVGGTRNCDWWFTDEAVFLDTAGRYTTQDSDAASDAAAWAEFLSLLVKYRTRRPLNGVILTISAPDLMMQGDAGREAHVEAARRRLNELGEHLGIQLPVYVVVTKTDLVAGFAEYFDELTQETRAQVWGVTFPYDDTIKGQAAALFPPEFDELMARLNARVLERVEEERDLRRRAKVFAFPQQMAALREALAAFVSDVFATTRLDRQNLLRGVYFTSGTQEGTPVDRLLGAIARRYGVAPEAVPPPTGRGKAFFVERLLKEVVIAESGLAGVNRRLELRKGALQLGAYAATAILAVAGVAGLWVSYSRNQGYLAQVRQAVDRVGQVARAGSADPAEALLPRLNAVRAAAGVAEQHHGAKPWSMRWGLFRGTVIGNAARDAYVREMESSLLPRLKARIEERLGQYAAEPEVLFEYLKAYLMLGMPARLDAKHLQQVAALEWPAPDAATESEPSLATHFESLFASGSTLRPIILDQMLVEQARSSVRQASVARIVYDRLKHDFASDPARAARLDQWAGLRAEQVIRRRSGTSLAEPISSFYVRPVFKEVTEREIPRLVKQFAGDDWVWGENKPTFTVAASLRTEVSDLYERDYIDTWQAILDDLELVPLSTVPQAAEGLALLAGPTSPLKRLLGEIARNTTLVEQKGTPPPAGSLEAKAKGWTDKLGSLVKKLPAEVRPGAPPPAPGLYVTSHFDLYHRLTAGEAGKQPIDQFLETIGRMQAFLQALANDPNRTPLDALADPQFKDILDALRRHPAAEIPVIRRFVEQLSLMARGTVVLDASAELERMYRKQVLEPCRAILADRYPFSPTSPSEVPMYDFVRLFGFNGIFDAFFTANLESNVERTEPAWTWRPDAAVGSTRMLETFQAAERLRNLFFRRGQAAPDVGFTVDLTQVSPDLPRFVLEIDGQYYESRAPRLVAHASWPGTKPGRSSARVETRSGADTRAEHTGAWGFFRLFDRHAQRVTDTRFLLRFDVAGEEARVVIDLDRIENPFARREWQRFTCGP